MIVFKLRCDMGHEFEAWFRNSAAYDRQVKAKKVECPDCGSAKVGKAIMAPNIATTGHLRQEGGGEPTPDMRAKWAKMADKLRDHVESNFDYVGEQFPDEARRIHYGETEERGIYGEATGDETKDLLDEGIIVAPLPGTTRKKIN